MEKQINTSEQNQIIKHNAKLSIIFKGLEYLLSFLTTPVLLSCLGDYKYGVYTTALSIVSWIYYFDFGIGSGLRNRVSESIVKDDYDTAHNSINVAYILVSAISIFAFLLVLILSFVFDFDILLNAGLKDENLNFIITVAIFLACLNFILSLSTSVLYSLQKTGLVSGLGILSKALMVVALLLYKIFDMRMMLGVVIIEGITQLVKNLVSLRCIYKSDKRLSPDFKNIDYSYSKGILGFGIQIFFMQIAALVLNSTDNIIIMKYFSASDVTSYSMCHKYFSIINAFFVAATGPLWTTYTNAYALKDVKYIKSTLKKALIFYGLILTGIIVSFFVFKPFMKFYLGKELDYQDGIVFFVGLYYALLIFSHNFSAFVHGISKVRLTTIACIIGSIVNIPTSIFMAVNLGWGLNGVVLGSVLSLVITTIAYVYTTIIEIRKLEDNKC